MQEVSFGQLSLQNQGLLKAKRIKTSTQFYHQNQAAEFQFDWRFYVQYYEDLDASNYREAYEHWIIFGQLEGRLPNQDALESYFKLRSLELPEDFDYEKYLGLNPDLQEVIPDGPYRKYQAIENFLQSGQFEGRPYQTSFDWKFYVEFYDDLKHLSSFREAYEHWMESGQQEGRLESEAALEQALQQSRFKLPKDFNYETYLDVNPDLRQDLAGSKYKEFKAIEHFLRHGNPERRNYNYIKRRSEQNAVLTGYEYWLQQNTPNAAGLQGMAKAACALKYQPLISIVMPTYNTPEFFLREAIDSVLEQAYPHWELCIADDASTEPHVRAVLEEYAKQDSRIKVVFRRTNGHISIASNSALSVAIGEFVALLDHDDVLTPDALYEVALLLNHHPEADMIYSDEDKMNEYGKRSDPYFKPDWCPDSFLTRMYTCHLGVYRRSILNSIRGFRIGVEGSQDYDLVLRVTEKTNKIYHIPKILYSWRIHANSAAGGAEAKPYAFLAAKKALSEALKRRGEVGEVQDVPGAIGYYAIRYKITDYKLVSIIIPTRDMGSILDICLESIFSKSTYPSYEVIVVDNGSVEENTFHIFDKWSVKEPNRFKCYRYDIPFNYSQINNYAVNKAGGDYLLFLNNDTEVITPDWIDAMVEQVQRSSIGAVGAMLLYPDNTIQHAGVILGIGGLAAHGHHHFPGDSMGYSGQVINTNNVSAVTGACLMCRRQVFEAVGGFDQDLAVAYNDVDLCLKIADMGHRNIYVPHAKLYHHESKSRGYEDTPEKQARWRREADILAERWHHFIQHDPCYNPHLTRLGVGYSIRVRASVTVLDVTLFELDADRLWGFALDSPNLKDTLDSDTLVFSGWVVGKNYPVIALEIVTEDAVLCTIPVTQTRLDVAQIYPDVSRAKKSGFTKKLKMTGDRPEQREFLIQAVLEDHSKVKLGLILILFNVAA